METRGVAKGGGGMRGESLDRTDCRLQIAESTVSHRRVTACCHAAMLKLQSAGLIELQPSQVDG